MASFYYYGPASTIEEALSRLVYHRGYVAVDTETVSLKDRTCIGIGVAVSPTEAFYFPCDPEPNSPHSRTMFFPVLQKFLDRSDIDRIYFNAPFDIERLEANEVRAEPYQDLSIMCHVSGLYNALDENIGHLLAESHTIISDILPKRTSMRQLTLETVASKCVHDCMATFKLYELIRGPEWAKHGTGTSLLWRDVVGRAYTVTPAHQDCYQVDMALLPLLRRMGRRGIKLNQERVEAWYQSLNTERLQLEDICTRLGFNPASNQQVGITLAYRGNFLPFTKGSRLQLAVGENELKRLTDPLAFVVLAHRKKQKLLGTYIEKWRGEERAFSKFRLDLATGRLASFDRNMQNLPPAIRDVLEAESGIWTWWDYSQVELRNWAYQNNDSVMLEAYYGNCQRCDTPFSRHDKVYSHPFIGRDVHAITQERLWPGSNLKDDIIRTRAKTFNFALIYLAEDITMAGHTGRPVEQIAKESAEWKELYHEGYNNALKRGYKALDDGYAITDFGRYCRLPDMSIFGEKHCLSCGINYADQGTAADCIKRAMLLEDSWGFDQALQVHDEVLLDGAYYEIPQDIARLHPGGLVTPFSIKQGPVWS